MVARPISQKRRNVLYTSPLLLGLASISLISVGLFGLVPWRLKAGTALVIRRKSSDPNDHNTASFHFGLLGSCYQLASGHRLHCTSAGFPPDYSTTIATAGKDLDAQHLQISMPDLPPVFFCWLLVSYLALLCHFLATLPIFAPQKLGHHHFRSQKLFSAALWILGIGWTLGFSAVLSLACFVQGFGDEYNRFSPAFLYNHAHPGPVFLLFSLAMAAQLLIVLALVVQIANCPSKSSPQFSSSWADHLRVTGP